MFNLRQPIAILIAGLTFLAGSGSLLSAQETVWINSDGGIFSDIDNWDDGVPDIDWDAIFDLSGSYQVELTADHESKNVTIRGADVEFFGDYTYRLPQTLRGSSSTAMARIDLVDDATLRLNGTSLVADFVGGTQNDESSLLLSNGASIDAVWARAKIVVLSGSGTEIKAFSIHGSGELRVEDGASIVSQGYTHVNDDGEIDIPAEAGAITSANWIVSGGSVENRIVATNILVENGGSIIARNTPEGINGGFGAILLFGDSHIQVDGAGSTIQLLDTLGDGGARSHSSTIGSMSISNGGSFHHDDQLELTELVTVDGGGSELSAGTLVNQNNTLSISGGGTTTTGNLAFGQLDTDGQILSQGAINLVGNGSSLSVSGNLDWQAGSISLSDGAQVSTEGATIGLGDGVSITSNSTWHNNGDLQVGGEGHLTLDGGTLATNKLVVDPGGVFNWVRGTYHQLGQAVYRIDDDSSFELSTEGRRLWVDGQIAIENGSQIIVSGDSLVADRVKNDGRIDVLGDDVRLGSTLRHDGYQGSGVLNIGSHFVKINDANFAQMGRLEMAGGTLAAVNGIALNGGSSIYGSGNVKGRIAANLGSHISAFEGDLTIGDDFSLTGFASNGELYTDINAVTIKDSNQAQLGTLTHLGGIVGEGQLVGGVLNIDNGAIIDFGDNMTGFGSVNNDDSVVTALINNGVIAGRSIDELIELNGYVKGVGTFDNVQFNGTFAPGLSPTVTHGGNLFFAASSILEMELAGLTPGFEHDAIQASGLLGLDGTLDVQLLNGFDPMLGDSFDLFDWATIDGQFNSILLPELELGLRWDTSSLYSSGSLSISSVPEPSFLSLILALGIGVSMRRKRRLI